jgi:prolyl-tRNA editing enzyme YbaK/EbsC (Cys-tRNA(Pro) deacylase)
VPALDAHDDGLTDVERRVRGMLDDLGVDYDAVPSDPALADTATFCATYGYDEGDSPNTIVVKSRGHPPRYVACVVLATTRLDVNGVVRRRLERKASFAGPDETVELTGMSLGGVTPVGLPEGIPIWIDPRVMERKRVILGAGSRRFKIVAAPGFLRRLPGAEIVDGLATDR